MRKIYHILNCNVLLVEEFSKFICKLTNFTFKNDLHISTTKSINNDCIIDCKNKAKSIAKDLIIDQNSSNIENIKNIINDLLKKELANLNIKEQQQNKSLNTAVQKNVKGKKNPALSKTQTGAQISPLKRKLSSTVEPDQGLKLRNLKLLKKKKKN